MRPMSSSLPNLQDHSPPQPGWHHPTSQHYSLPEPSGTAAGRGGGTAGVENAAAPEEPMAAAPSIQAAGSLVTAVSVLWSEQPGPRSAGHHPARPTPDTLRQDGPSEALSRAASAHLIKTLPLESHGMTGWVDSDDGGASDSSEEVSLTGFGP
jgi:hypothetical protein